MQLKRLLITISLSNSIRYVLRTGLLYKLRAFCEPVLVFTWNQEDVIHELREAGFEVYVIEESEWQPAYAAIRRKIDIWFDWFVIYYPSRKIERKYLAQFIPARTRYKRKLREFVDLLRLLMPGYRAGIFKEEQEMLATATNYRRYETMLSNLKADAVFTVTPFHRQEDIFLRACKHAGLKMITSILSFDNITKRGWIPVLYDAYMVWNKYNRDELERIYPETRSRTVSITGAAQFDFYFDQRYLYREADWRKMTGLNDASRKIILYAGGPKALFPNEPQYLIALDKAISEGKIKGNPIIFFRCHPVDRVERWKEALGKTANVIFDVSWAGDKVLYNANVTVEDIKKLCSTLAYTDVHINLCSTMTVDGSAYGKPQIAPYYDAWNRRYEEKLRKLFAQQHFLPIMQTGGLLLARSEENLVHLVNAVLSGEIRCGVKSASILQEIITYTDGNSTSRVAGVIESVLTGKNQYFINKAIKQVQ